VVVAVVLVVDSSVVGTLVLVVGVGLMIGSSLVVGTLVVVAESWGFVVVVVALVVGTLVVVAESWGFVVVVVFVGSAEAVAVGYYSSSNFGGTE